MRNIIVLTPALLLLGACVSTANVPPKVSWSYGAGNGDGVQYQGPQPIYSFSSGVGSDVPVSSGGHPTVSYAYGAESTQGDMIQMAPQARQQVAQPATTTPSPNTHS